MAKPAYLRWAISALLVAIVIISSGQALYLGGKAWLAQHLLMAAWHNSETNHAAMKPWPWADVRPAGLLELPQRGIQQVALAGHSGEALAFGPGAVVADQAVMLAGHRDSHFQFMAQLEPGEIIVWQELGQEARHYQISTMEIIDSQAQETIIPPPHSLLLVTCFPFDAVTSTGPLRYVVVATPIRRF